MTAKKTLSHQELKDMLRQGEPIENAHIESLSLSKWTFEHPIQIHDCKIDTLDLNKSTFQKQVSIRRCGIDQLILSEAVFEEEFDLLKCSLHRGRFQKCQFKKRAKFSDAALGFSSFHQSEFHGELRVDRAIISGDATFTETILHDRSTFIRTKIEKNGHFNSITSHGELDFSTLTVGESLFLQDSTVHGNVFFRNAQVALNIDLKRSRLEGETDFLKAIVGQNVILTAVDLGEKQGFRFLNSSIPKLVAEHNDLEGHVLAEQQDNQEMASKEYGILRNHFRDSNNFDGEDWAYYHFKRNERRADKSRNPIRMLSRGLNYLFLDLGCGYGTYPFRTLGVCFAIIAAFAVLYTFTLPYDPQAVYGFASSTINHFFYGLDMSLKVFSGGYSEVKAYGAFKFIVMFEYLLGIVFLGLFVVAYSRKIIR